MKSHPAGPAHRRPKPQQQQREASQTARGSNSLDLVRLASSVVARSAVSDSGESMRREFNVVIERDSEGFYVASVPALHGCHTQAKSLDELMERVQEAISLCLEAAGDEDEPLDFVGVHRISVTF